MPLFDGWDGSKTDYKNLDEDDLSYRGLHNKVWHRPHSAPELAKMVGIDGVEESDNPDASLVAMVLVLADRVRNLEKRVTELESWSGRP